MKKFLALAVLAVGLASAQVVPFGLDMERGVKVLAFVAADCPACEALRESLVGLPVLFMGAESDLPYIPYAQDTPGGLVTRTFRVEAYPTVAVLKDGQFVYGYRQEVDARLVAIAVLEAEQGTLTPPYEYALAIGEPVEGDFADYTGLIVFWRESCPACLEEEETLTTICRSAQLPVTVLATRDERLPDSCPGWYARELALSWGIPGVPSKVFLKDGRVTWLDLGYREDLEDMFEALVATEGEVP